ncbi:MAG: 30S ribosomal protein S6 [Elusimicrobia bacterium]|nr:30S ribosomal protein S6 [Elusimicrobiota bacterium]
MRTYETVLILKPVMSDPEVAELVEKAKQVISGDGGEVVNNEIWGRRKLTHLIGKAREGVYAYLKYRANPPLLKKLRHNFSVSGEILRDMTVVASERKYKAKEKKPKAPAAAS